MLNSIGHLAARYGIILSRQLSAGDRLFAQLGPELNTAVFCRGSFTCGVLVQR